MTCRKVSSPQISRSGGFAHVEILVAILIIGLTTPMMIGSLVGSLRQARRSQDSGAAAAWLQGEVDYLRAQCFERLSPSTRKASRAAMRAGEPSLPDGFGAAVIRLETAGAARLKASVSLYKTDWTGTAPADPPVLSTTTYIGDIRVAGNCP